LKEVRNDSIWINGEDITQAFRPLKMGLPISRLADSWERFEETYNRVENSGKQLFNIEIDKDKR